MSTFLCLGRPVHNTVLRVSVGASDRVVDGFGLPLEASSLEFRTRGVDADFSKLSTGRFPRYAVFESSQDWGRKVLSFSKGLDNNDNGVCSTGSVVDIWSITSPAEALPVIGGGTRESYRRYLGAPGELTLTMHTV